MVPFSTLKTILKYLLCEVLIQVLFSYFINNPRLVFVQVYYVHKRLILQSKIYDHIKI